MTLYITHTTYSAFVLLGHTEKLAAGKDPIGIWFFGSYVHLTGYVMLEYLQAYRFIPPKTSFQQVFGKQVSNGFLNVNVQNSKLTIVLLFCNDPVQVHDLIFQSDGYYTCTYYFCVPNSPQIEARILK